MQTVRLIYVSTVTAHFGPRELDGILSVARERNVREDMTGVLFFTGEYFIQCLEGDRLAVNRLYNDMMRDPRHRDLVLLDYSDETARHFGSWSMAFVGRDEISQEMLLKHSGGTRFDPYALRRSMAHALILLLATHVASAAKGSVEPKSP